MEQKIENSIRIGEQIAQHLMDPDGGESSTVKNWADESGCNRQLLEEVSRPEFLHKQHLLYNSVDGTGELRLFRYRQRRRRLVRWSVSCAASVLLCLAGIYYVDRVTVTPGDVLTVASVIQPGTAKAILVLDNEEQVLLTDKAGLVVENGELKAGESGLLYKQADSSPASEEGRPNRLMTPRGGEYKLVLSDGTTVYLNAATTIDYPVTFGADKREVRLSGEAYFEVATEPERPFYVVTDAARLKVYGTSFNVNTYACRGTQVALVTGKVGVRETLSENEHLMAPSQMAEFDREGHFKGIRDVDVMPYVGWKQGRFLFEDESLEEIMYTLSRWYDVDISFASERVKRHHFTGNIERYKEIDVILNAISKMVGVTFAIRDNLIIVNE